MIRTYLDADYEQVKELYRHSEWYGGTFDEHRDGQEVLARKITNDPQAILVDEENGEIVGTISVIEDGRVAWLYRFVVKENDLETARGLYGAAAGILKSRGHNELLVYSDENREDLRTRYLNLGMQKGGDYDCFYAAI